MARERSSSYPALAASAGLHVGVIVLGLFVLPLLTPPAKLSQVTPVTLISANDPASMKNAVEAPTPAPAATETPTPQAAPQAPAPQPAPTPVKAPAPAPTPPPPKPTPVKPAPTKPAVKPAPTPPPTKAAPAKAEKSLDLDALAASLQTPAKTAGAKQSSAQRGPNRAQTAVKAQTSNGVGSVASNGAMASMAAELQRLWNPNCEVNGGDNIIIKVGFRLGPTGRLIGYPESSAENATDPVIKAASDRAKRAVNQAAPFENLPPELYGPKIVVNFDAKQACAPK